MGCNDPCAKRPIIWNWRAVWRVFCMMGGIYQTPDLWSGGLANILNKQHNTLRLSLTSWPLWLHRGFLIAKHRGNAMHKKLLTLTLICAPMSAVANIPSTEYVQQQIASQIATAVSSKVDTSASANQTMAGTYTVSGTFNVSTPTLPTAE